MSLKTDNSLTLTGKEIRDLAEAAGLEVAELIYTDELETEMTIIDCPATGVLDDNGRATFYKHIAFLSEHPEEGSFPLGDEIPPPSEQQSIWFDWDRHGEVVAENKAGIYRKKPVTIEAFQMTKERRASNVDWPEWMHRAWQLERETPGSLYPTEKGTKNGTLSIGTIEGQHLVSWGDWIVRGVKGELYPCKPDIFKATYEAT